MRRFAPRCVLAVVLLLPQAVSPTPVAAAGCVRFVNSQFNAPGPDADNLNGEWVRIKNVCATRRNIGGWKIHDYGRNHTYTFPDTFRIPGGGTVTLFTGSGDNTRQRRYWGKDAPVWNNNPLEFAHLRKPDGTLMSRWTEY